jgi:carbon-monoxide dehydrogenase medium subunit
MYPPKFEYYRAATVDEAVALLQSHSGAKLLAGGHSLLPALKLRLADPGVLIDIGRISQLKGIERRTGSVLIGAMTTHATVAAADGLPAALTETTAAIGDVAVRNRGTVGGNVAHADPASDLPTVFLALDARFHVTGPAGARTIPAADFFVDLFTTALQDGEILTGIEIPLDDAGTAYAKYENPASRYSLLGAAAALKVSDGVCKEVRVAVGGLTPKAIRAPSVEQALLNQPLDEQHLSAAAGRIADDLGDDVMGDIHASAEYRRAIAPVFVQRALTQAAERA